VCGNTPGQLGLVVEAKRSKRPRVGSKPTDQTTGPTKGLLLIHQPLHGYNETLFTIFPPDDRAPALRHSGSRVEGVLPNSASEPAVKGKIHEMQRADRNQKLRAAILRSIAICIENLQQAGSACGSGITWAATAGFRALRESRIRIF
jgi:hypothetical protein